MINNVLKIVRGLVGLVGGTDQTTIGNVGDRLKVDAAISFAGGSSFPHFNSPFQYDDMNASNGGVARDTQIGTTFTNIYSYTGSGYLLGFSVTNEDKKEWYIQLNIDGTDLFIGSTGLYTKDLDDHNKYGFDFDDDDNIFPVLGFSLKHDTVFFHPQHPIRFATSITIKQHHTSSNKKFRAGLVQIIKE